MEELLVLNGAVVNYFQVLRRRTRRAAAPRATDGALREARAQPR